MTCRPDQLFGAWSIEPGRFAAMVTAAKRLEPQPVSATSPTAPGRPAYELTDDGVAVIDLSGPLTKYETSFQSFFGGTSTVRARATLRDAARDPRVHAILLRIDSPGGTVAGTSDLAEAIKAADARKPVHAYIEDLGASAAYWLASQARRVSANTSAEVGSIGVFAVLEDTSGAYAKEGVKVHVVKAGAFKGLGVPGTAITDAQLSEVQRQVDAIGDIFVTAIASGRQLPLKRVKELADGRVHIAQAAKDLGLIDEVGTLESAVAHAASGETKRAHKEAIVTAEDQILQLAEQYAAAGKAKNKGLAIRQVLRDHRDLAQAYYRESRTG